MFETAFIQEEGHGRLMLEARLAREHCVRLGLPVHLYTPKRMHRRQLPLNNRSFIFGDMDCMHGAMRQLRIPIPEAVYYPPSMMRWLHRKVWNDTLGGVRRRIEDGSPPIFAKPASRAKVFTGRVFAGPSDFYHAAETSLREPVWCSEVVAWRSEYRVYVNGADIVAIDHYQGDASTELDMSVVERALAAYRQSGEAPAAHGVDFGILSSGQTALVEANDGYALGAYRIASAAYTELLFARWRQLLASALVAQE
jgi:hypothetical protein